MLALLATANAWGGCTHDCNGRGKCVEGLCLCEVGFFGDTCEKQACPLNCNGHGSCSPAGLCSCDAGWSGEDCSTPSGGLVVTKQVVSKVGWTECSDDASCSDHGTCLNGKCACHVQYYGARCEYPRCPSDCSHKGTCEEGMCKCEIGWTGPACDTTVTVPTEPPESYGGMNLKPIMAVLKTEEPVVCPENCNLQGKCNPDGTCGCYTGYTGPACDSFCPNMCSGRGECIDGGCLCVGGYGGADCSMKLCCNGHGDCDVPETCICHKGWMGAQCGIAMACTDPTCSGHGTCDGGTCDCEGGWSNEFCQDPPSECDPPCPSGQECDRIKKMCVGDTAADAAGAAGAAAGGGGGGDDAGGKGGGMGAGGLQDIPDMGKKKDKKKKAAPEEKPDCGPHGTYNETTTNCDCEDTWFSSSETTVCDRQHCPGFEEGKEECNGQGLCLDGKCHCVAGFGLLDESKGPNTCKDPVCVANCGDHGTCKAGVCDCQPGWQGEGCDEPDCGGDCSGHGLCSFVQPHAPAQCKCEHSWVGAKCEKQVSVLECPNDCMGNGLCLDGQCVCSNGWGGPDCTNRLCSGAFLGPKCDIPACPNDCDGKGLCFQGTCQCWVEWSGDDCSIPIECYEACEPSCRGDYRSVGCEACKGRCTELSSHFSIGKHNPFRDLA